MYRGERATSVHRPTIRSTGGMTLIEVLVAMIILGTLLTTALSARARYVAQATRAAQKEKGVTAADGLLAQWAFDWPSQSADASGEIPGEPQLHWSRRVLDRTDARDLGAKVLRLQVRASPAGRDPNSVGNEEPLAVVEVVVPLGPAPDSVTATSPPSSPLDENYAQP